MKRIFLPGALLLPVMLLVGCGESETSVNRSAEQDSLREVLGIPEHFPLPYVPEFNLPTEEKIALGRRLFYEERLSANETQSCASCHEQARAFADGETVPTGSSGERLTRNSQGLANVAYHPTLTWASKIFTNIESQLHVPLRADNPIELGITDGVLDEVLDRFNDDPLYSQLFANAFPEAEPGVTINKISHALASFVRTMVSADSAFDRWLAGDEQAMTDQQKEGFVLFNGEKFECFHCHGGINFSVSYRDSNSDPGSLSVPFFNNGLYNVGGDGSYPPNDQGLYELTQNPNHRGLFRPPTLRNVAVTQPYMHDGSIETLREVVLHYARGGRRIADGPLAGDGRLSPLKSGLVRGFSATEEEVDAVVAFLEALTDETFLTAPEFSDPEPE